MTIFHLSQKLQIPQKNVAKALTLLCQHPKIENRDLLCQSGLPEATLKFLLKELYDYLARPSKYVALNKRGREIFGKIKDGSAKAGTSLDIDEIVDYLQGLRKLQSKPKRKWDQFLATPETVASRVRLLLKNWDLQNKKVLFLGDSDLTSLAVLKYLGKLKKQANIVQFSENVSITVLDIDKELLDFIAQNDEQQIINLILHDLCQKLPRKLHNQFDTVFTDPPYTEAGMTLFLSRAVDVLKKNILSRLYFCFGTSYKTPEKTLRIQEILNEMNLVIEEKYSGFNQYEEAYSIGGQSGLYVCSLTEKSRAIVRGDYRGGIYTKR